MFNQESRKVESLEKIPPPPQSNSFITNLLTAVHYLQGMYSCHDGVTADCIESYMIKHFQIDGDIKSQISCAIHQSLRYGFLQKQKNGKYFLIYALAKIQLTDVIKDKQQKVSFARKLFKSTWESFPIVPPPKCCNTVMYATCHKKSHYKRCRSSSSTSSTENNGPCYKKLTVTNSGPCRKPQPKKPRTNRCKKTARKACKNKRTSKRRRGRPNKKSAKRKHSA